MFYYGLFIFVFVYAFTELMDGNPNAWAWEILKFGIGIYFIIDTDGWFGLRKIIPIMPYIISAYLVLSLMLTFYFKKENNRYSIANQ